MHDNNTIVMIICSLDDESHSVHHKILREGIPPRGSLKEGWGGKI